MIREYMDQDAVDLSIAFLSDRNHHNDNTRLKNRVSTLSLVFSSSAPSAAIRHFISVWSNLSFTFWRILFATASAMTSASRSHSSLFISINCSARSPRTAWSRPTIFHLQVIVCSNSYPKSHQLLTGIHSSCKSHKLLQELTRSRHHRSKLVVCAWVTGDQDPLLEFCENRS